MASRRDYFYRQLVAEDDLDAGFAGLEDADRAIVSDLSLSGVCSNAVVSQHAGTPNISVDVSAPGVVYDKTGQRILIPSLQNKDVSIDDSAISTSVSGPGNEKWVSVFVKFARALSDPQVDGNSNTVFFVREESFTFSVVQGAEAAIGLATRPAVITDGILLADINRTQGQTQILNADISTTRREDQVVVAGTPRAIRRGFLKDAISDVLGYYNNHVTGVADAHTASALTYAGGGAWRDGATNPTTTIEAQLDKIISDLVLQSGGTSGAEKIGSAAIVGAINTIVAGTPYSQMVALKSASNLEYGGGGTWADASTNPAATVEAQLDKIVSDLASTSGSGADKVGCKARTAWLGGRTNVATTVFAAIDKVITDLAATGAGDDGAERIGLQARTTWLGGRTNVASDVFTGIDKIITDLAAVTASDDGAERIGAQASGGLSAGSVRSQLDALDTTRARITDVQLFLGAGGTWNKPTGAKDVFVYLIGSGGGGGAGRRGTNASLRGGGGGGGGGGKTFAHFDASSLASTETVTVGAVGTGASAVGADNTSGGNGTDGGDVTFGTTVMARAGGGLGGAGGTAAAGGSGGTGGTADLNGGSGGDGGNGTAAAGTGNGTAAAGGGGGGGGITAGNSNQTGADGGARSRTYDNAGAGTAAGTPSGNATNGGSVSINVPNGGGGGGGTFSNTAGASPGTAGSGGRWGGGGGGGAAVTNGNPSGAGANGFVGVCVVITHC